jgi:hypothetical protein
MSEVALQLPLSTAVMPADVFLRLESAGNYTGERFRAQRPEDYERVLVMLQERIDIRTICAAVRISHHTVKAIRDANPETIATGKERVGSGFRHAAELLTELASNAAADGDARTARDAMVGAGIAAEKWMLLVGEATQRIEHREENEPDLDSYNVWIHSAAANPGASAPGLAASGLAELPAGAQVIDIQTRASDCASGGDACAAVACASGEGACIPGSAAAETSSAGAAASGSRLAGDADADPGGGASGPFPAGTPSINDSTHGNFQCNAKPDSGGDL